ncbi:MAG: tetratricopeptide repeat protein [Desulfovibrio sp.]|jgi:tetratricopeptide (TPR) repeat protein|nr:tetratricopeptide repeat protein [Desulfovibrio sp.]
MGKNTVVAMIQAQKTAKYENTVIDFVHKDGGKFIILSEDQTLLSLLRTIIYRYLGLNTSECLVSLQDVSMVLKAIKQANDDEKRPFLIMERQMNGEDLGYMVKQLKAAFPNLFVMIMTGETNQHRIMYLHEIGVDNFVVKPVSAQTLIEKMAFTIKPQDSLGQLVEDAKGQLQEGNPQDAKATAHQILEAKPGSPAGLMVLGDAELALGNMEAARAAFQQASENADLYLEPLRRLARLAKTEGDFAQCLKYLERLDHLSPLNFERKIDMGEINLNLGNGEKAEKLFNSALNQVTREAMDQIGNMAERIAAVYGETDPAKSEMFLRKAIKAKEDFLTREDLRIFNQLGVCLRRQGRWRDAIAEYQRALRIADDEVTIHYNMGMAFSEGGLYRDARISMDKALRLDERLPYVSATVAYNIGVVYLRSAARDKARHCFEVALELKPDMEKARKALQGL